MARIRESVELPDWHWADYRDYLVIKRVSLFTHYNARKVQNIWWSDSPLKPAIRHLNLRPDSQVLDLGCGRGALLTRIAKQLGPAGKVTGLDLWLSRDQSHNKMAVTQKNVDDLGLTDRVNLVTGDMTKLAFPDASFDVVTSSFAIHNIKNEQARISAVKEAIRVLKPGGHIMIIDTGRNINEYGRVFQDAGLQITQSMGLGFNGWWATPLTDSYVVAGNKPATKTEK